MELSSLYLARGYPNYQQQKCRPMTLVSGDIGLRFMRILAEVPWGEGVKRQWGCRRRRFSAFALAISSETLEMSPELLYSVTQSVVNFSVIPKCMTLNDTEWLFRVKFGFRAGLGGTDHATFAMLVLSYMLTCYVTLRHT